MSKDVKTQKKGAEKSFRISKAFYKIEKYIPANIESKWQEFWAKNNVYPSDPTRENTFYVLAEFAYPSGDLHMGHWFTFSGADIYARFKRMQGYNVFFPNGFDAFGLPAENAAIKRNIHPQNWTLENIERMKKQYGTIGASFSFKNEVITCLPEYYRWNQWIFLKMFEKGIAYRSATLSNWCPKDQTVLANEHVENGKCWRCGETVVQKEVEQWFLKITEYADKLIWQEPDSKGLSNGVDWPDAVRVGQNNWIGKSEGAEIDFKLSNGDSKITVYTVYPETIYGVTYMVIAPEHDIIQKIIQGEFSLDAKTVQAVKEYVEKAKEKSELDRKVDEKEKTGVPTGISVINPVNGREVPVWVADYVIGSYGTGAVMGVPSSDHRDFAFAHKYNLPIIRVIGENTEHLSEVSSEEDVLEAGVLVNSGEFDGLKTPKEARSKIIEYLVEKGYARRASQYHLHDWSVSRQRYWGTPVPIIHCDDCGNVPVPEKDLPVELPYDVDYAPKGKAPLASNEEWVNVKCPTCGKDAKRDPETLDTFFDSSWYFFRFLSPKDETAVFDQAIAKNAMPVGIYFGGAEHTLGHTLYARFFTKFFHDLGLTDLTEFAAKRVNHGVILGPDGNRMSKSKGNVVNPDEEVKRFGSDTIRVYLAFFMPYEATGPWDSDRVWGSYRFLQRIWGLFEKVGKSELSKEDLIAMNKTIKKITEELGSVKYNTSVAALMEWLNHLSRKDIVSFTEYRTMLQLLAPIAPHITEELWSKTNALESIKTDNSIHQQQWPEFDKEYLVEDLITIVVQVNGKKRAEISLPKDSIGNQNSAEEAGRSAAAKYLEGNSIKKAVYIPGKILNFVI